MPTDRVRRAVVAAGTSLALALALVAGAQATGTARPTDVAPMAYPHDLPVDCPAIAGWRVALAQKVFDDTPGKLNWLSCQYTNTLTQTSQILEVTWVWRGAQPVPRPSFGCGVAEPVNVVKAISQARSQQWEWGTAELDPSGKPGNADVQMALNTVMSHISPYAELCPAPTSSTPSTSPSTSPTSPRPTTPPAATPFRWKVAALGFGAKSARIRTRVAMAISFQPYSRSARRLAYVQIRWPGGPWKSILAVRLSSRGYWGGHITSAVRGLLSVRVVLPYVRGTPAAVTPTKTIRWY